MILTLYRFNVFVTLLLILLTVITIITIKTILSTQAEAQLQNPFVGTVAPKILDSSLKVELVYTGPGFPTNMAFIGPDDILLLSKNDGKVLRIKDGKNLGTVLEVNVSKKDERGLLGIATEPYKNQKFPTNVFLYYSLCSSEIECNNFAYKYDCAPKQYKLTNPSYLIKIQNTTQRLRTTWKERNLMGEEAYLGSHKKVSLLVMEQSVLLIL